MDPAGAYGRPTTPPIAATVSAPSRNRTEPEPHRARRRDIADRVGDHATVRPDAVRRRHFAGRGLHPAGSGYTAVMSDLEPESFAEFVTTDGPGSADADQQPGDEEQEVRTGPVNDLIERSMEEPDEGSYR
ncbi:hypothetical protein FHX34_103456 [Actinoplanes teichomyceticus]|uniref:Uncharacterized protein n=2 Tax=Actinoplanes teichomyceticus TaxID=1867 RepID=A0A561WAN8_ACTTI|nr:hypothetical protein FHX34_103456 [Actinoplanes teichomyceticus]GIF16514.1 hypothetical protein Ate01nite_65460 [Actinoplanes teichomyceticus]